MGDIAARGRRGKSRSEQMEQAVGLGSQRVAIGKQKVGVRERAQGKPRAARGAARSPAAHGGSSGTTYGLRHMRGSDLRQAADSSNQLPPSGFMKAMRQRTAMSTTMARKAAALVCGFCSSALMLSPSSSAPPASVESTPRLTGRPASALPLPAAALLPLAPAVLPPLEEGTPPYCRSSMRIRVR